MYGIKGTHNDVSSSVLDAAYVVENGKMVMETDLDLNGKRLLNYNPKSKTVIFGKYDRVTSSSLEKKFKINGSDTNMFGFDFTLKKITLHVLHYTAVVNVTSTRLRLYIYGKGIERYALWCTSW